MFQKTFLLKWPPQIILFFIATSCGVNSDSVDYQFKESKDSLVSFQNEALEKPVIGFFEQNLIDQGLSNIQDIDSTMMVDLKYSTTDNFFGKDVYGNLKNAYLPMDVVEKLRLVNERMQKVNPNLRLYIFDAVRPQSVQQVLWDALDSLPVNVRKAYVADPAVGSLHNYGCAVDISIFDIASDSLLDMGTNYDYFGYLAYPRKEVEMLENGLLNNNQIDNRLLLREAMINGGFIPISSEWWHFNCASLQNAKRKYKLIK
jgi:D-alanyl-D-alanine dipeptidase